MNMKRKFTPLLIELDSTDVEIVTRAKARLLELLTEKEVIQLDELSNEMETHLYKPPFEVVKFALAYYGDRGKLM